MFYTVKWVKTLLALCVCETWLLFRTPVSSPETDVASTFSLWCWTQIGSCYRVRNGVKKQAMWFEFVFVHVRWSMLSLSFSICSVLCVCYAGQGWLTTRWTAGWLHPQWAPVPTKTITKPAWPPMQGSLVSRARVHIHTERKTRTHTEKCTIISKYYTIFLLF